MKNTFLLFTLFTIVTSFGQQAVKSLNLNLNRKTEVFQIVDEDKNQVLLFFSDKKNVRTIRLNQDFEIEDSLITTRPSNNYDDIVGYSNSGQKYFTYWTNSNNKEILTQCFDFNAKNVVNKSFKLDFEKEKNIKKITVNNVFYLINIVKNSSILHIYAFQDGTFQERKINLSSQTFFDSENKRGVLWNLFNESTSFESALSVQNISNDSPPSLAFSANKRKVYTSDNQLFFAFDNNQNLTQTITINLNDFSASYKSYTQPFVVTDLYEEGHSNSFYINQKLIQTKLNSKKMVITVKDLTGTELNKFEIESDKEIAIKNSDIIQENGSVKNTRVLDKSNQLIRKIYNLNPTIACYLDSEIIYLTIGGVSLVQDNNAVMYGGMLGGFTGALIGAAISSNYSLDNLNSYKKRKVVYINCKFDLNFKHIEGESEKLAFDKLREYEENHQNISFKTVFKKQSSLYFGGYQSVSKTYTFYKFED